MDAGIPYAQITSNKMQLIVESSTDSIGVQEETNK